MESGVTTKGHFRFRKKERITHPQDFRRVMKFGRKFTSKSFILFMEKNQDSFHRLGIVVKKEVGPATFRNRIRRYIREFFRLHKYDIKGSFNIILLVRKGCSADRYREAEAELKKLFVL
jgi:ribonuclease P protein component